MSSWVRVSRRHPCPVCGRPDWCLIADDDSAAICARMESPKRCGEAGWLHRLVDRSPSWPRRSPWQVRLQPRPKVRAEEVAALSRRLQAMADKCGAIDGLSAELGLSPESLIRFGVGWSVRNEYSSWPMFDHRGWIVGINRRFADGTKKIIKGHRAGLYLPADLPESLAKIEGTLLVTEGGSDAVAGMDFGLWSVGRFSCTHGTELLVKLANRIKPAGLVLVGDTDGPGRRGVESLASVFLPYVRQLKVIYPPPPHKDLRAWRQAGGTFEDLMRIIDAARQRRLGVEVRGV